MKLNQKLLSLVVVLLLVTFVGGCFQPGEFAVTDSNMTNYKEEGVTPEVDEINLEFSRDLDDVDVVLQENEQEKKDLTVAKEGNELIISELDLKPIADYKLTISVLDEAGNELVNEYQFVTEPTSYPQVEEKNDTILQSFYWEIGTGDYAEKYPEEKELWKLLGDRAPGFSKLGITSLWVPPANKAHNQEDEGYAAYDLWDLGEFEQAGSTETKYGSKEELEQAISELHQQDIEVYYDGVLNQRIAHGENNLEEAPLKGGETIKSYSNFSPLKGRQKYYSKADEFKWNWKAFDGVDYGAERGEIGSKNFRGKSWDDTYGKDYLMAADVDYENENVQHEIKEWGSWLVNEIGFDGYRLDAVKHIDSNYLSEWLTHVQESSEKDIFFVGEAWIESTMGLRFFINGIGNENLKLFDFPLRNAFTELSNGSLNMSSLDSMGLVNDPMYGDRAVMFVDNHDTSRDAGSHKTPIMHRQLQAYTYMLTREQGYPMVFWKDLYNSDAQEDLKRLLKVRKNYAYGPGREVDNNGDGVYSYVREGLEEHPNTGLVAMISVGTSGEVATRKIKTNHPDTTFYDYSRNIKEPITTDEDGYAEFKVHQSEDNGWSTWVPSN
ncbi:MAG: alpha-amylase family glycosyl hydrolase [Bacillota bacterium]